MMPVLDSIVFKLVFFQGYAARVCPSAPADCESLEFTDILQPPSY